MQYTGRARVNARNPQAFAVCQRCSFWINHVDGSWQFQWGANRLYNTRIFVCRKCLDVPSEFLRTHIYPPDPVPIKFAFPQDFTIANNGSPIVPPLPWPSQEAGPAVSMPPTPEWPVYVTPPLPPLPQDIGLGYPQGLDP